MGLLRFLGGLGLVGFLDTRGLRPEQELNQTFLDAPRQSDETPAHKVAGFIGRVRLDPKDLDGKFDRSPAR